MTDEELDVFQEVVAFSGKPSDLHPLKLDKWWKTLVGAPDLIYLQMGFHTIFGQIDNAALAIKTLMDLVGKNNFPVSHREVGQRHIGQFNWHVPGGPNGTYGFSAKWDKDAALWVVGNGADTEALMVADLKKAVEKSREKAAALDSQRAAEE